MFSRSRLDEADLHKDLHTSALFRPVAAAIVAVVAFAYVAMRVCHLETGPLARLFCIALMLSIALLSATASGRVASGTFCASLFAALVWRASVLKLHYMHEPLMAPDLRYLAGTLAHDVMRHYPHVLGKNVAALAGGVALAVVLWRLESPGLWRRGHLRKRVFVSALATVPLLLCLWPRGPFHGIYSTPTWDFIAEGERNPLSTFVRSFREMRIESPPRAAHANAGAWQGPESVATPATKPDIVAVLEESTLDPRQWADCTVPRCTFPMFQPDAATRAFGPLRVHTYGGATWTSEFTFFAGLPQTVFGPAGIYAPYNLAPRMRYSLPRQLKALGYRTVAVYPMPANFVDAADAYRNYGFDEFHDSDELGLTWGSDDQVIFDHLRALFRRLRAETSQPLFFMVATMRQHGPHDEALDTLPPPWNEPPAPALGEPLNRNLGTYLYRLHRSDTAIADLRAFLFDSGRPALLVQFGDHHPSFDGLETTLPSALPGETKSDARVDTYYRIDTNFAAAQVRVDGVLDLAFLGGVVLEVAGLPADAYFQANERLREACAGLFDRCRRETRESYFAYVFDSLHAFDE